MMKPRLMTATRGRMQHVRWSRWSALWFVVLLALVPLAAAPVEAASRATPAAGADERTGSVASQVGVTHASAAMAQVANDRTSSSVALRAVVQAPTATTTFTGTADVYRRETRFAGDRRVPNAPRSGHTATLLPGGKVLIAGGTNADASTVLATAALYDPATETYTSTGNMHEPHSGHTATLLANGKVLIIGRTIGELYDPATGTFTKTGSMQYQRSLHTATLLTDGKVLVVGGYRNGTALTSAELYDPATGTFTSTGSTEEARRSHTATLLADGKVLITGGDPSRYLASAELYDPATGMFTSTGGMQEARAEHTATLLADGTVLITGGVNNDSGPLARAELYDPRTGTFFRRTGSMQQYRYGHTATRLADGKVLIAGGRNGSSAEIYNPATGTWMATGSLRQARNSHTATLLANGKVLVVSDSSGEVYDPATEVWTLADSITEVFDGHTATLLTNGKVLIVDGSRADVYDPVKGTFTPTPSPNKVRLYHTATLLANGKVLIAGGTGGDGATAELYDPGTGTFTLTGNMQQRRIEHTATLMADGKVLIVGGYNGTYLAAAELYDPGTGTFTLTGSMQQKRIEHTATLLANGKVLVVGGRSTDYALGGPYHPLPDYASKAEVYDPAAGTWTVTGGSFKRQLSGHTATLLPNGKVFFTGGEYIKLMQLDGIPDVEYFTLSDAFLYEPTTGGFTFTGSMPEGHINHTATLLPSGNVLITGGAYLDETFGTMFTQSATSVYDPAIGLFTAEEPLLAPRTGHTATLLPTGEVLLVGGADEQAELIDHEYVTTFNGTLTLPSGWSTTAAPSVTFRGSTTGAPLTDGALNDGPWIAAEPNADVTTTLPPTADGRDRPVLLRLRDAEGRVAKVVLGHVDIDATLPRSQMNGLPATSRIPVTLQWGGYDATSGIASYDVEVRDGVYGAWTPLVSRTKALSTSFTGEQRHTYFFRVRARDVAGNLEAWPETFDTKTQVDIVPPTGSLRINNGAAATTSRTVYLTLNARDAQSPVTMMRFAQGGTFGGWLSYRTNRPWTLVGADGVKQLTVQFQDSAGNISQSITPSIRLDMAAGTTASVVINNGAVWTNTATVALRIGAPEGTAEMQISNVGTFANAVWQPFDSRPTWKISTAEAYSVPRTVYVRTRDSSGQIRPTVSDRIMYDPQRPTGSVTITSVQPTSVAVRLQAQDPDNVSGVKQMRVSLNAQFTGAQWQTYRSSATLARSGSSAQPVTVYAQFQDGAGNLSTIATATSNP